MPATITEKILARAANKAHVAPGDNIWVRTDVLMTHDVCGPGTIGVFKREFGPTARVWDPEGLVIAPDHYIFTKDQKAHRNIDILRQFAKEQELPYFYDPGTASYKGVCHLTLPEEGHVRPGTVLFGTDSHTCTHGAFGAFATGIGNTDAGFVMGTGKLLIKVPETMRFILDGEVPHYLTAKDIILHIIGQIGVDGATYCAMEFQGEALDQLNIDERMTICNMTIEAGAKNGIMNPDETTLEYVRSHTTKPFEIITSDPDASAAHDFVFDVAEMVPCVAKPDLPSNYAPASECSDTRIDRAYIGSCTGGKITDFRMAAQLLRGHRVTVDTFLVPASTEVTDAIRSETIEGETLEEIFINAGCKDMAPPSCAACLGGPVDTFGRTHGTEVVISTTNRNFIGRMGSKQAPVYLASPLTVAASAIRGHITDPREFI